MYMQKRDLHYTAMKHALPDSLPEISRQHALQNLDPSVRYHAKYLMGGGMKSPRTSTA